LVRELVLPSSDFNSFSIAIASDQIIIFPTKFNVIYHSTNKQLVISIIFLLITCNEPKDCQISIVTIQQCRKMLYKIFGKRINESQIFFFLTQSQIFFFVRILKVLFRTKTSFIFFCEIKNACGNFLQQNLNEDQMLSIIFFF
jgi:hypothetical protein